MPDSILEWSTAIVSILAFILAVCSYWYTWASDKKRQEFETIQNNLNQKLIEIADTTIDAKNKAELFVEFNEKRMIVSNRGAADAEDVKLSFPDGLGPVMRSEVEESFPHELLAPDEEISLIIARAFGTPKKLAVKIEWNDESAKNRCVTRYPSL